MLDRLNVSNTSTNDNILKDKAKKWENKQTSKEKEGNK